jgi:glycosyltransferase involved in cell wall biosynthesis
MDISVIIPFHNEEKYIEKCIHSLLSQDYPKDKYEIIMISNNSTDRSEKIVKGYPAIKLLYEHKPGAFASRNRAIIEAKGKIIAFTDADCIANIDWLSNIYKYLKDSSAQIVQGTPLFESDTFILKMLSDYEAEKASYIFSRDIKEIYYGSTNNMAVRTDLFNKLGLFSEIDRGADVLMVQNAIKLYTCDIAIYACDMCIRHLEISNLRQYYQKLVQYGNDFRGYYNISTARPLNTKERLFIYRKTIQINKYSNAKSIWLLTLLCFGGICYELGRRQAIWNMKNGKK